MSLILMIRENQTLMVTQLWRERYQIMCWNSKMLLKYIWVLC